MRYSLAGASLGLFLGLWGVIVSHDSTKATEASSQASAVNTNTPAASSPERQTGEPAAQRPSLQIPSSGPVQQASSLQQTQTQQMRVHTRSRAS